MPFPFKVTAQIDSHNGIIDRSLFINRPLTIFLGPNGSGKTHLLRAMKKGLAPHAAGKVVRFLSAGRMGMLEQFRSDYDGQRNNLPNYDNASFGSKDDSKRRHRNETLNGDFQTLAERADVLIKIQERLRKLFKRDLLIEWDAGRLKVLFAHMEVESKPYSSGREASGLMHLVGILAALYDDEVGALLIDEPEVSLHPQLQAFLLKEILHVAGDPVEGKNKKIVVIATHSTEMVQIKTTEDLPSLVFCYDLGADPVQISVDAGELKNKKISGLIARLGQEHKLALFCKRPLLVEGPSDVMICSALSSATDLNLEAAGSQILPVIGKGQIPVVTKLLHLLGKEPVALADADGFADGLELSREYLTSNVAANKLAASRGFDSANAMADVVYSDFCKLIANKWDEVAAKAKLHPFWKNKGEGEEDQAKRRAAFSVIFSMSDAELNCLGEGEVWAKMKSRLSSLLDVLEAAGLFVLRKGSIESYYHHSDVFESIGKPSAAADEMEFIGRTDRPALEAQYADILRCIRYASNSQLISEADALRDLLLAVVAPAQARLKSNGGDSDMNMLSRTILAERSKIFDVQIADDSIVISMQSNILDVPGFPLTVKKHDDAVQVVTDALECKKGA